MVGASDEELQAREGRQGELAEEGTSRKRERPRFLSIAGGPAKERHTLPPPGDLGAATEGQHVHGQGMGCKRKWPDALSAPDGLKTGAHTPGALLAAGVQLPTLGFFVCSDDEFTRRYVPVGQQ